MHGPMDDDTLLESPPHPVGSTSTMVGIISRELLSPRRPACACHAEHEAVSCTFGDLKLMSSKQVRGTPYLLEEVIPDAHQLVQRQQECSTKLRRIATCIWRGVM